MSNSLVSFTKGALTSRIVAAAQLILEKSVRPKCGTTSDTSVTAVELYARAVGRGTLKTHSPTKQGSAAEPSGGE